MESFLYGGIAIDYYNIVEFVSQGECKYFHEKYKLYSEAVIGGRGADIQNTKMAQNNKK